MPILAENRLFVQFHEHSPRSLNKKVSQVAVCMYFCTHMNQQVANTLPA